MDNLAQKNVQADGEGKWQITIPNDFSPGQHTAVIKDGTSEDKGIMIFKNPEKPYLITKIEKVVPGGFFYAVVVLLLITVLLFMNYIVLGKKNRKNERRENIKRYLKNIRRAVILCLILIPIVVTVGLVSNKDISWKNIFNPKSLMVQEKPFDVSGSIVHLDGSGVSDLDLSVGNVSIHTAEGGFFNFNSVNTGSEIKITSPLLKKSLSKKIDGKEMRIIFEQDMYNRLIDIVDLESRGKISEIYDKYLSYSIKSKTNKEDFIKSYESIFTDGNILDQKTVVGKVELIKSWVSKKYDIEKESVLSIEVFNASKSKIFYMISDGKNWTMAM